MWRVLGGTRRLTWSREVRRGGMSRLDREDGVDEMEDVSLLELIVKLKLIVVVRVELRSLVLVWKLNWTDVRRCSADCIGIDVCNQCVYECWV